MITVISILISKSVEIRSICPNSWFGKLLESWGATRHFGRIAQVKGVRSAPVPHDSIIAIAGNVDANSEAQEARD
jgi:hypothetical protein